MHVNIVHILFVYFLFAFRFYFDCKYSIDIFDKPMFQFRFFNAGHFCSLFSLLVVFLSLYMCVPNAFDVDELI